MAFMGTGALSNIAHADALTKAKRDKLSPNDILELMKKGNKRFWLPRKRAVPPKKLQAASAPVTAQCQREPGAIPWCSHR